MHNNHYSSIKRWENALCQNGYSGAIRLDLSKGFHTINSNLLIVKLGVYGFDTKSLKLINIYLTKFSQRMKVNASFSNWTKSLLGVSKGSVMGSLLSNIYIKDLFYLKEMNDICNYADDTTFHVCELDLYKFYY